MAGPVLHRIDCLWKLMMVNRVVERLKERLAERPDGPGKGAWEGFDEYLTKEV